MGPIFMQVVRDLLLLSCFSMDIDILYIKLKLSVGLSNDTNNVYFVIKIIYENDGKKLEMIFLTFIF